MLFQYSNKTLQGDNVLCEFCTLVNSINFKVLFMVPSAADIYSMESRTSSGVSHTHKKTQNFYVHIRWPTECCVNLFLHASNRLRQLLPFHAFIWCYSVCVWCVSYQPWLSALHMLNVVRQKQSHIRQMAERYRANPAPGSDVLAGISNRTVGQTTLQTQGIVELIEALVSPSCCSQTLNYRQPWERKPYYPLRLYCLRATAIYGHLEFSMFCFSRVRGRVHPKQMETLGKHMH